MNQLQAPNHQLPQNKANFALVDTHCHIHEADYPLPVADVLKRAADAGVRRMILVGTSEQSSADAIKLASEHDNLYAAVGVHPHDTKEGWGKIKDFAEIGNRKQENGKVVAIGEIGLDYYYNHSPRDIQIKALESQIQIALDNELPIIFHVREAFDDFWPIFDNFHGVRGVLHSFTDTQEQLNKAFARGLYIGINGISTFAKDSPLQEMFANVPLERMLLETDAPFLTPTPYRGTINEPAFVSEIAKFHAKIRGVTPEEVATTTTANAMTLFKI